MQTKTLFSQHYLETRLPQHAEWDEDPAPVYEALCALWDKAQQFGETWSEAQTEDEFIKPTLTALGWTFTVQPKSQRNAGGREVWDKSQNPSYQMVSYLVGTPAPSRRRSNGNTTPASPSCCPSSSGSPPPTG